MSFSVVLLYCFSLILVNDYCFNKLGALAIYDIVNTIDIDVIIGMPCSGSTSLRSQLKFIFYIIYAMLCC